MEALTNFSSSIEYIESRLQEKIEIEEVAKITHFTKFHYQRMFYRTEIWMPIVKK